MIRLSAAVMAHPSRREWVTPLVHQLDTELSQWQTNVAWDRIGDPWDTARRAWALFDPEASHHLVVQDDALLCRDLIPGVEKALKYAPADSILSLYLGNRRPVAHSVEHIVRIAREQKPSWIQMNGLNWGVAVVIPTRAIPDMIPWCDNERIPGDDNRIRRYFVTQKRWPTWCPWPSLVDHRQGSSLLGHRAGRHAHGFVGSGASALDVDFSQGYVIMDQAKARRPSIRRSIPMADQKKTPAKKATKKAAARKPVDTAAPAPAVEAKDSVAEVKTFAPEPRTAPEPLFQPEPATVELVERPAARAAAPDPEPAPEPKAPVVVEVEVVESERPKFPKNNRRTRTVERGDVPKRFRRDKR